MTALRIRDGRDIRTVEQRQRDAALLQQAADLRLEATWRIRVAENIRRRIAEGRYNAGAIFGDLRRG